MQKQVVQQLYKNLANQVSTFKSIPACARLSKIPQKNFCYVKHHLPFEDNEQKYIYKPSPRGGLDQLETFRVIDLQGDLVAPGYDNIPDELLNRIFEMMIKVEEMDTILNMSQRQGKISFYMPSFGEYATTIASSAALKDHDLIYSQYREQGALMWRGFTFEQVLNQCMGTNKDLGKGRQMPIHYGSKELNWVTISSPLTTQVPQASGSGYAYRLRGEDRISVTFFGEGAASEGDFHSALNFGATLECQTLFLCRNNKWAISTPAVDQYRGDGIAGKAMGYGIQTYRVDGNDALAVYQTIKLAREYIIENKKPAFVELMTYRVGDHSTSDHSVLYRTEQEIQSWKESNNPLNRLGLYLKKSGKRQIKEEVDDKIRKDTRAEVIRCLKEASKEKLPHWDNLFTDVYDQLTPNLIEQSKQLNEHLEKYGEHYNLSKFVDKE